MSKHLSPLRYPGGKAKFSDFLADLIFKNQPVEIYAEPYAGGAGAALELLLRGKVKRVVLNDLDYFIYMFWKQVIENSEELIGLIENVDVSIDNYIFYKSIYRKRKFDEHSDLEIGFTTFFLNRCSRSGILKAGPIGGYEQKSKWEVDCRFNKEDLIERIEIIANKADKIEINNLDAIDFIEYCLERSDLPTNKILFYLDPPYVMKGASLYRRNYDIIDHQKLNQFLKSQYDLKWALSYDDVEFINDLYQDVKKNGIKVNHFASKAKLGNELLILSDQCKFPDLFRPVAK